MLLPHHAPSLCEAPLRLAAEAAEQQDAQDAAMDDEAMEREAPTHAMQVDAPTSKLDAAAAKRFVTHALAPSLLHPPEEPS